MVWVSHCDSCGATTLDDTRCWHCKRLRSQGKTKEECEKAHLDRLAKASRKYLERLLRMHNSEGGKS